MRYTLPIVVKRLAPMQGRPESPRRIAVEYQTFSVDDAVRRVIDQHRTRAYWEQQALGPDVNRVAHQYRDWYRRAAYWIEKRGLPATVKR